MPQWNPESSTPSMSTRAALEADEVALPHRADGALQAAGAREDVDVGGVGDDRAAVEREVLRPPEEEARELREGQPPRVGRSEDGPPGESEILGQERAFAAPPVGPRGHDARRLIEREPRRDPIEAAAHAPIERAFVRRRLDGLTRRVGDRRGADAAGAPATAGSEIETAQEGPPPEEPLSGFACCDKLSPTGFRFPSPCTPGLGHNPRFPDSSFDRDKEDEGDTDAKAVVHTRVDPHPRPGDRTRVVRRRPGLDVHKGLEEERLEEDRPGRRHQQAAARRPADRLHDERGDLDLRSTSLPTARRSSATSSATSTRSRSREAPRRRSPPGPPTTRSRASPPTARRSRSRATAAASRTSG